MNVNQFKQLQEGDIVRGKSSGESYVVVANYGDRVTAIRVADMTNPDEWELVRSQHPMMDPSIIMPVCPGCGMVPLMGHRPGCRYG